MTGFQNWLQPVRRGFLNKFLAINIGKRQPKEGYKKNKGGLKKDEKINDYHGSTVYGNRVECL
jgi:hypothetical protein